MSLKAVKTYQFPSEVDSKSDFLLSKIDFEQACVANDQIERDFFNIIWIKEGRAKYHIDFSAFEIKQESVFFLNPGQVFTVESEEVKSGYRIAFSQDFYCVETNHKEIACNGLLFNNIYENPFIVLSNDQCHILQEIIDKLIDEFEQSGAAHGEMLNALLKQFLIKATRFKVEQQEPHAKDDDHDIVLKFSQLVEKHFREKHAVSDYADMLGISPKTLSKKFLLLKQRKPSDFVKDRLILEAKRELHFSDRSIKEIAYGLGFEDPAYFVRFFKKITNKTPKTYRYSFV
ncbi:AraC family transcriptional regulator [Fulvivirgaceae bacterium BMA10]|uniref:AraC family transcriptional regulator n=1 Tax=Splendidivirga corallicola TaxID=3051826 RepID=A0ABT8KGP7_9BACT|nr:AraC family transcriptional regulator [Fulvivirgaceae bacterium BMA10]